MGRLLTQLAESGLERDTLVIFMNDNGGTAGIKIFNDGMRGSKVTPWQGRRPGIQQLLALALKHLPRQRGCLHGHISISCRPWLKSPAPP